MAVVAVGGDDVPDIGLAVQQPLHGVAFHAGLVANQLPGLGQALGCGDAAAKRVIQGRGGLAGGVGEPLHQIGEQQLGLAAVGVAVADILGGGVHALAHSLGLIPQGLGRLGIGEVELHNPHRALLRIGGDGHGRDLHHGTGMLGAVVGDQGGEVQLLIAAHPHGQPGRVLVDGLVEQRHQLGHGGGGLDGGNLLGRPAEGDGDVDFIVGDDADALVGHIVHGISAQGVQLGHLVGRFAQLGLHVAVVAVDVDDAALLSLPDKAENGAFQLLVILHGDGVSVERLGLGAAVGRKGEIFVACPGGTAAEQQQKQQYRGKTPHDAPPRDHFYCSA